MFLLDYDRTHLPVTSGIVFLSVPGRQWQPCTETVAVAVQYLQAYTSDTGSKASDSVLWCCTFLLTHSPLMRHTSSGQGDHDVHASDDEVENWILLATQQIKHK